eukprot:scaffold18427_cov103-Skeletonema_marinoi.AAC.2
MDHEEIVVPENARAVCGKELPPVNPETAGGSILLFYQYVEDPIWTKAEHKAALKKVIEIGTKYNITGRGRVAREGLNCTLTGKPHDIRSFCYGLREWNDVFNDTDFKITDGVAADKMFKALSIRKTNELVAYGLAGDKAPSLKKFAGEHLEADDYHKAMQDPDTVIIDVRNAYESAIGHFQPPEGGAKLIDPKMRNSIEFPKWLNSDEAQKQLTGKKVLMYCTGGIRCERATALLNQMSTVSEQLKPQGVYHCRGGIERYVKTYPSGGFWKGKNYLFDKRMEQTPDVKDDTAVEKDISSKCCLCRATFTVYRNQFKCSRGLCGVPVIVCTSCTTAAVTKPASLMCELCREGYKAPSEVPNLVAMKRAAEKMVGDNPTASEQHPLSKKPKVYYKDRIFLRRVPLTATFTKIKKSLGEDKVRELVWLVDKESGAFYGSCVVLLASPSDVKQIVDRSLSQGGVKVDKKRIKVAEVFQKDDEDEIFNHSSPHKEYPPIGAAMLNTQ